MPKKLDKKPYELVKETAVDWNIKETPRFLYYLLIDAKKNYLQYYLLGKHNIKLYAKYTGNLYMLYMSVQSYFDNYINQEKNKESCKYKPNDYFELQLGLSDIKKTFFMEKQLMTWLFNAGPFKTSEEQRRFDDIATQLDYEYNR